MEFIYIFICCAFGAWLSGKWTYKFFQFVVFDGNFEFRIKFGDCFELPNEQEEWHNKIPAKSGFQGEQIKYIFVPQ